MKDELEYHKYLNKLAIIKNCITIICFTILAIVFQRWWLILLSIIFYSYVGKDDKE